MSKLKLFTILGILVALLTAATTSLLTFLRPTAMEHGTLALWSFDKIQTPEEVGDHAAILGGMPPPAIVEGKYGKALSFDGRNFLYTPITSNLYASEEITIEAWIRLKAFKEVEYNNVVVIAYRSGLEWQTTTRICGIAVTPSIRQEKGFLRGYVYTDKDHFNEIMTMEPIVPLDEWVHVAFVRSLSTGMHLFVNGEEAEVTVTYGVRNPKGKILMGTEIFFGHDAEIVIDEPRICDVALDPSHFLLNGPFELAVSRTEIDIGPNLLLAVAIAAIAFAAAWLLRRAIQTWGMSSRIKE
ncbi:MAG: LamG domain-containing protein [Candidatus Bathyarchaeota archaeon]|nr:LamG domain-containing protein [Candidatus Bathyarchaeota archaeon]